MRKLIIAALMSAMFMTATVGTAPPLNAQVSFGIRIGPPPNPRVLRSIPRQPGPGYVWIDGYWYPNANGRTYRWHSGYWTRLPFDGARWVPPYYDGQRFYDGYWENDRERLNHDHRWDRNRDRDYRR